jgi:hypothetical protein
MKHRPHKEHKFAGTPNPDLDPIKAHVRENGGWSHSAWKVIKPRKAKAIAEQPKQRLHLLTHEGRRFIIRALDAVQASNRLTLLLSTR